MPTETKKQTKKKTNGVNQSTTTRRKQRAWKRRGLIVRLICVLSFVCLLPYITLLRLFWSKDDGAASMGSNAMMEYMFRKVGFRAHQTWKTKIILLQRTQSLAYDSRYLPPYNHKNDWLPHGHVIRELGQRLLSRHIASSHVLLMGRSSVVSNLTQAAREQDHVTHVLSAANYDDDDDDDDEEEKEEYLDSWWSSRQQGRAKRTSKQDNNETPNWWLLTLLDQEQVFSSLEGAAHFFANAPPTMTYIVVAVTATVSRHHKNYTFTGMDTIRLLQEQHYKVQLLSATDFWSNGVTYNMTHDDTVFLPNSLITEDNLQDFFEWGAQAAATSRALVVDSNEAVSSYLKERNISMEQHVHEAPPSLFKAYLFCTQGLDLAIPSRREYLQDTKFGTQTAWPFPYSSPEEEQRATVQRVNFTTCGGEHSRTVDERESAVYHHIRHDRLQLLFRNETNEVKQHIKRADDANYVDHFLISARAIVFCDDQDVTEAVISDKEKVKIWGNDNNPKKAESICIRLDCNDFVPKKVIAQQLFSTKKTEQVSCSTRIIPAVISSDTVPVTGDGHYSHAETKKKKDNLLVVLLDPVSRTQFDFLFPRTVTQILLNETLGFVNFEKYTTVGNNSGPNQAALYAGLRLLRHDGIGSVGNDNWIWDQLNNDGYATFKAEDGCIANSNMVQSMKPKTTHGQALHELFCFHFARPNCVGNQLAANLLLDHVQQFIDAYSAATRPWAAFLSVVDTHEDTMTLGAIIDTPLRNFLSWATEPSDRLEDTTIVVLSDHGLHYGPYFQSTRGERERSEPILFLRPSNQQSEDAKRNLVANADKYVTAFDVHETLLKLVGIPPANKSLSGIGSSLVEVLPKSRLNCLSVNEIPTRHCTLVGSPANASISTADQNEMPSPPSLASFYADIPRDHRWKQEACKPSKQDIRALFKAIKSTNEVCKCATSHRNWFICTEHPWDNDSHPEEYFITIQCPRYHLHFQARVVRDEKLLRKRHRAASKVAGEKQERPNILVIELDSVSIEYADRHFPRTRELLRRHRVASSGEKCHQGVCGVNFSNFSVVGPNSVSNQVASLSGCLTTHRHPSCSKKKIEVGDICEDPSVHEFGMKVQSLGPTLHTVYCPVNLTHPFIYDIAQQQGYLTFFGEEFCYNGSPWVVQGNVFRLNANFAPHKVFCRLAQHAFPEAHYGKMFRSKVPGMCVDYDRGIRLHKIGLELINQMWNVYEDVPKFAYLNAMAAHEYTSKTAKAALTSEEYDEKLATWLESFLARDDAKKTIIVVRSDHGLQGGEAATVDYSTQIESVHPWTEILVPDRYPVDILIANSAALVTPFDLYTMMKDLMVGGKDINRPDWMFDMLHETVPHGQSCDQRKIPAEFCPMGQTPFPSFGVCNMFESRQAAFCRYPTNGAPLYNSRVEYNRARGKPMGRLLDVGQAISTRRKIQANSTAFLGGTTSANESAASQLRKSKQRSRVPDKVISSMKKVKQLSTHNQIELPCGIKDTDMAAAAFMNTKPIWSGLDRIVAKFRGGKKVSGGIFLYPRQSIILISLLQLLELRLDQTKGTSKIRVCETGFGAGHSTALFLAASPRVEVISFDKFDRPYQLRAIDFLNHEFGETRLRTVSGDTCKTVPELFSSESEARCDFIHGSSLCPSDMIDLMHILKPNGVVTATAMDGLLDKDVYFGPKAQWRHLRQDGCISHTACWKEKHRELKQSFVFANLGTDMEHKFCVALNTGKCSPNQPNRVDPVDTTGLDLGRLCSASSQIKLPA